MEIQGKYRTVSVEKRNSGLFQAWFNFNGILVNGDSTTEKRAISQAKKWANTKDFSLNGFHVAKPKLDRILNL